MALKGIGCDFSVAEIGKSNNKMFIQLRNEVEIISIEEWNNM